MFPKHLMNLMPFGNRTLVCANLETIRTDIDALGRWNEDAYVDEVVRFAATGSSVAQVPAELLLAVTRPRSRLYSLDQRTQDEPKVRIRRSFGHRPPDGVQSASEIRQLSMD